MKKNRNSNHIQVEGFHLIDFQLREVLLEKLMLNVEWLGLYVFFSSFILNDQLK